MIKNSAASSLKIGAVTAAVGFMVMYVMVALRRMPYPFELEWMEGSMVDHVQRVLSGLPLYAAPTMDHVAFGYPPLFYWAAAAVAQITGIGLLPLRIVSFAASIGMFLLIVLIVRRETGRWMYGVLAAGTFAATYRLTGGWFDVGRVDSLFLMLVLAAIWLVRQWETWPSWALAGLLLAAAVLTKQVALLPAGALILYGWFQKRRLAIALTGTFAATLGILIVWQNASSGGWFWYYVFAQPASHRLIVSSGFYFMFRGLCFGMGIPLLATLIGFAIDYRNDRRKTFFFWMLIVLSLLAAGALPLMKAGGWQNDLMPAHLALAMMLAMGVQKLLEYLAREETKIVAETLHVPVFVWIAVLIQLGGLVYEPSQRIPTALDERAGRNFVAKLRAFPGDVLVLNHGYLPRLAGKEPHANYIGIMDILNSGCKRVMDPLLAELRTDIATQRFAAIILDAPGDLDFAQAKLEENYRLAGPVFDDPKVLMPVTGNLTRPEVVYVPKEKRKVES